MKTGQDIQARSNLTASQFVMWLGQQLAADVPLYNMIQTFTIEGDIDTDIFSAAIQSLIDQADALRTIIEVIDGVPQQRVLEHQPSALEIVDLSEEKSPDLAWANWVDKRKTQLLTLDERLFDTALIRLGTHQYVWYLCQHHLISDAHSFTLAYQHTANIYQQLRGQHVEPLPELHQYSEHQLREEQTLRQNTTERSRAYWSEAVDKPINVPQFYDRQPTHAQRTDRIALKIDDKRSSALRAIAATDDFATLSANVSLNGLWTSLVLTLLHRITGEQEFRA